MIDKAKLYEEIELLQKSLEQQGNAYDYEKTFDEKWRALTQQIFQESLGDPSKDRNKKNDNQ